MSLCDKSYSEFNSQHLAMMVPTGTRWLIFRDVPDLIDKYVKGNVALDYGCGKGSSTKLLHSCGLLVDGVDTSEDAINYAKQFDPYHKYTLIESAKIPANNNHYDLVFSSMVLPYIATKKEIVKVLRESHRCLRNDGTIIACVNSENTFTNNWSTIITEFEENKDLSSGSITKAMFTNSGVMLYGYLWNDSDYREVFSKAGFKIVCIHQAFGKDTDKIHWTLEKTKAPFTIYIGKKK